MIASYENIVNIPVKSTVEYKQYSIDRHDNKVLEETIIGELFTIITPQEQLSSDLISTYYKGVSPEHYPALSYSPDIRLVIITGYDRTGVPLYKTVSVNKYFSFMELQTVEYTESVVYKPEVPNQILGFNSYDIGKKFKT